MTDYQLDARRLEPPEPFLEARKILEMLAPGETLFMLHRRLPHPLLELAKNLKVDVSIECIHHDEYHLLFKKK